MTRSAEFILSGVKNRKIKSGYRSQCYWDSDKTPVLHLKGTFVQHNSVMTPFVLLKATQEPSLESLFQLIQFNVLVRSDWECGEGKGRSVSCPWSGEETSRKTHSRFLHYVNFDGRWIKSAVGKRSRFKCWYSKLHTDSSSCTPKAIGNQCLSLSRLG